MWAGPIDDADVGIPPVCGSHSGLQLTTMGRYCIVWGCSNTNKNGVSLFQFPKDTKLRRIWATAEKLGFKMKQRLTANAIPTIFPRPFAPLPSKHRTSRAHEKRECSRVRNLLFRMNE